MRIKSTFFAIALLFSGITGYSQTDIKDSAVFATMIYATYAYQVPQGDLAKRFGGNSTIGGGISERIGLRAMFRTTAGCDSL